MKVDRPVLSEASASEGDWRPRDMRAVRRLAMVVLPVIALIGAGLVYAFTGRYVSTDNAYVKADIVALSPEVSGTVAKVLVRENEQVVKGQELVRLDATMYVIGAVMAESAIRDAVVKYHADLALLSQKAEALRMAETDAAFAD